MWPRRDSFFLWKQVSGDESGHRVWMAIILKGFTTDEYAPVPTDSDNNRTEYSENEGEQNF